MKLTMLREHYRLDGSNWVAKKSFKSWKEIRELDYPHFKWKRYRCSICGHLHVASIRKGINSDY